MTKYEWKLKSLAKGIDPNEAIKEIERIENVFGSLTPENVLKASEPGDAILHSLFQWDDSVAAEQYRLQQARTILNNIEVVILSDGQAKHIAAYEVVNLGEGRVYKSIQNMDSKDIEYVKSQVRREIKYLKNKLSAYQEMEQTIKHLDNALETL